MKIKLEKIFLQEIVRVNLLPMERWAAAKKALSSFPGSWLKVISRLPADKADNETILEAVHRSLEIYLIAVESPGKPQLGDSR